MSYPFKGPQTVANGLRGIKLCWLSFSSFSVAAEYTGGLQVSPIAAEYTGVLQVSQIVAEYTGVLQVSQILAENNGGL
jgi:hypothetical protein